MPVKKSYNKKKNAFLLILIVIFGLILRLVFFSGIDTSDGLQNTKYAYDISKNIFPTSTNQANSRIGLLIPVSLLYSKFGVNDFTSTILILSTSIGGIMLIYFFGKFLFGNKVGLLSAFFLSFFPLDVINSTKFLSDLPSAFFASLSIFLFLKGEKTIKRLKVYIFYLLSGLSLGISFSIREMAVLAILFFGIYVLYNRKFKVGYFLVMVGFISVLSMEMVFFHSHTGDLFYRFHSLDSYYNEQANYGKFYGRLSLANYFLAWPYVIFGNIQLGYFYAFMSLAALYWLFNRKKETNYLVIWFLSVLLYLNFGSSSITKFAPFLGVARYLSYATIPGILLLSAFLMEEEEILKKYVLPFSLIFLFFTSIGAIYLDKSRYGIENLREAYSFIKSIDKPFYTDARSKFVLEYLSGYNKNLNIIEFEKDPKNIKNINDSYVVINEQMIKNREAAHDADLQFVKEIKVIPPTWTKVKEITNIAGDKIFVYYAK